MLGRPKTLPSQQPPDDQHSVQIGSVTRWYFVSYPNRRAIRSAPMGLPHHRHVEGFKINISQVQGYTPVKKNPNNKVYLTLLGTLWHEAVGPIGKQFRYQSEQSFTRENKWQQGVSLYLHSRLDKNQPGMYLVITVEAVEVRGSLIENVSHVGLLVKSEPFVQEDNHPVPIVKDLHFIQFIALPAEERHRLAKAVSQTTATISIESNSDLKPMIKFIPENVVFTHQDSISGLRNCSLPTDDSGPVEGGALQVGINYVRVDIPEKFEADIASYLRKTYGNSGVALQMKGRRVVVGYHNEWTLVGAQSRRLEVTKRETVGSSRLLECEALKEGQTVRVSVYEGAECCGVLAIGLVYDYGAGEIEVACMFVLPEARDSRQQEVSEQMILGPGFGATGTLLPFKSQHLPTLILQYSVQQTLPSQLQISPNTPVKSTQHAVAQLLEQQRKKLEEQIVQERMMINRQRQQMEKMSGEQAANFQAQFERKFELQKQNLYRRQQMIENQYKEQVEREIKERFELEQEIRRMNQKLRTLEETGFRKVGAEGSYRSSGIDPGEAEPVEYRQSPSPAAQAPPLRQRIDPAYVVEPQNPIGVKKARQMMETGERVNLELVKASEGQFSVASKFTFTFSSVVWGQDTVPPKSMYMVIRFFNQRPFRSQNLGWTEGEGGYCQLMRLQHYRRGQGIVDPSYSFTIDPSQHHQPVQLQQDLTQYLVKNRAIVDFFSAETHLYIGQTNIELNDLLRGTKAQTLIAREVTLLKIRDKEALGVLQILVKNQQVACSQEVSVKHEKRVKEIKKKVVSNGPIIIDPEQQRIERQQSNNNSQSIRKRMSNANRQQLRIQRFKEQQSGKVLADNTSKFSTLGNAGKEIVLGQIANYKEKHKQDYLKSVYDGLLDDKVSLSAHYGRATTFPYLFENRGSTPASFRVSILSEGETGLSLVHNSRQWRYMATKYGYMQPKRFDMVNQKGTFFLHPGQSVSLVFRYLRFIQLPSGSQVVNVTIVKEDNNFMAGGVTVEVEMHQQIIHHSYILYEPGDQVVDLIVPVIYSQTDNTALPHKLHISGNDSTAQWLNPYEILLRINTPPIMQKTHFNLLLYQDQYYTQLTQNWLIQVHAYEGVCTSSRPDLNTKFKVALPWSAVPTHLGLIGMARQANFLKVYASCAALVFRSSLIEVEQGRRDEGSYEIWCELLGSEGVGRAFEITCVTGDDSELVYGWAVTVFPAQPRV